MLWFLAGSQGSHIETSVLKPKTSMVLGRFLAKRTLPASQKVPCAGYAGTGHHGSTIGHQSICAGTLQPLNQLGAFSSAAPPNKPRQHEHRTASASQGTVPLQMRLNKHQQNALDIAGLGHSQSSAEL